jgi:hypothetical protein
MMYELDIFGSTAPDADFIRHLVENQWPRTSARFNRLWDYYANDASEASVRDLPDTSHGYIQAQEAGLPARITGSPDAGIQRKEIVIENDIAWRINAMVDFLFGKPITIQSTAAATGRRKDIESILKAVFDANGGAVFFQECTASWTALCAPPARSRPVSPISLPPTPPPPLLPAAQIPSCGPPAKLHWS